MNFICPTLGEDHEKDFLVMGKIDDFKIIVFSDMKNYNEGFEYLDIINPINHTKNLESLNIYRKEPYVISADIYTNKDNVRNTYDRIGAKNDPRHFRTSS